MAGGADDIDGYVVNRDLEYNKVITVIDACIDLGIYVIVDWHDHHAHENSEEAVLFFKKIATKYGDKPNIIYEIYNEPMQISWEKDVKPYSEKVIKAIREIDPDNIIVIGTPTWAQDVDIASKNPIEGTNLAYSIHFYASSHKQGLRDKAQVALDNGLALFATEYGTCEYTGSGIIDSVLHCDGNYASLLEVQSGGSKLPVSHETVDKRQQFIKMDGKQVFKYAVRFMSGHIQRLLKNNHMTKEDISWAYLNHCQ